MVRPSVTRERKCIATDDETLARFCNSGNSEPHVQKISENIWRERTSGCPDTRVVVDDLQCVRIKNVVAGERDVVGIQIAFFAIRLEKCVKIEGPLVLFFLGRDIRCPPQNVDMKKMDEQSFLERETWSGVVSCRYNDFVRDRFRQSFASRILFLRPLSG